MGRKKVIEQTNPWLYRDREILSVSDCPENAYGFVYEIVSNVSGKRYIGKKALRSYHTSYSKVLNEKTGRLNKVKSISSTESNWKDYFGSSVEVKDLIKLEGGKLNFTRNILRFCFSKKELTFREIQEQCKADVLCNDVYINSNIEGRYFKNEFK